MNADEAERQIETARAEWVERVDRRRAEQCRGAVSREGYSNKGKRPLTLEEIHELQRRQSDMMAAYVVAVVVLIAAVYVVSAIIGVVS